MCSAGKIQFDSKGIRMKILTSFIVESLVVVLLAWTGAAAARNSGSRTFLRVAPCHENEARESSVYYFPMEKIRCASEYHQASIIPKLGQKWTRIWQFQIKAAGKVNPDTPGMSYFD
jgi:hypothetical protein